MGRLPRVAIYNAEMNALNLHDIDGAIFYVIKCTNNLSITQLIIQYSYDTYVLC